MPSTPQKSENTPENERDQTIGSLLKLVGTLGFGVVFGIVLFFGLGVYLDTLWETKFVKLIGLLLGLSASFYWAYLQIAKQFASILKYKNPPTSSQHIRRD